jgi:hypothetical protein
MKTKRPKWATLAKNRRWKIVTIDRMSCVHLSVRITDLQDGDLGTYLKYSRNTIVKSPNEVVEDNRILCGPGIHAYRSRITAQKVLEVDNKTTKITKIISVYAPKWWGISTYQQRAGKVYVAS